MEEVALRLTLSATSAPSRGAGMSRFVDIDGPLGRNRDCTRRSSCVRLVHDIKRSQSLGRRAAWRVDRGRLLLARSLRRAESVHACRTRYASRQRL